MDNLNNIPNVGNWGDASSKLNDNFNKVKQAVTTVENTSKNNKGYFTSLSALNTAFPSPKAGQTAYVYDEASSTNYYIYNAVNGAWVASSIEAPSVGVDISEYTKTGGSTKTTKDIDDIKANHGYDSNPKTLKEVDDDLVQLADDMEDVVEKYYTGLGGENFFSKSDIVKYPVLRLFKKVWITGLQREVDTINTLSLTAVYGSPSNDQLILYFNVNGVNNGTIWENSYGITVDTTSIPDIITATSNNGPATQGIFNTRIHVEFDYSAFDRNTMNIDFTSISPDRRVFLTEDFVQNMKLEPNTIAGGTQLAKANRRAILGELPFYKKDYIDVDILQHFYDLKITNVENELFSLSITNLSVTGGKLQLIINQNNRTSGDIWQQSIVINTDIPSDGNEVIFSGFSSLCNFEVKLNLAEWDRDINLSAWVLYSGQYIADDKAIHILPEYIEKLKKGDTIEDDVEKHYIGFGIENRFSKQDIVDYPALKLFKYLEFSGLEDGPNNKNVQNISLTLIYKSNVSETITFMFNINGFNNGSTWSQSIIAQADITSNPDEIEIIQGARVDYYYDVQVHLIFDYSKYTSSMDIFNEDISPDKRIFISDEYVRGLKLDPTTTPGIIHSININRSAILGELPFHKKDYINNEALSYFYDLELTNIKESLMSLSITYLKIVGGKLQLIINENKRMDSTETTWQQSIVINATIPTEGDEVIFEGQKTFDPLCHFKIKFDYSKWRSGLALERQFVADNNAIEILPEYIEELKRINTPSRQFKSFSDLSSAITEIGGTGYLGGLPYERIALGATENAFRRNFDYKIPKKNTLKIVDYAATSSNIVDITEEGVVRSFNIISNRIEYFDSFEDLKNGVTRKILYDLPSMNPDFKGDLRFFWQLENGNILVREVTVGTDIGGLWLIDVSENTATKVFTYRNQWQLTPRNWALEFNENVIYLSEYGNSPVDSGIGIKADATKLWKSEDYGATWNELYDFKNIPNVVEDRLHIHSVHYDKSWDRLWVTTGDSSVGNKSSKLLLWSDDGGASWDKLDLALYWGDIENALNSAQGLSMYSTPDFLLIGGDDYQNCIYRVAKTHKEATPVLEIVYRYNPLYNDRITQFTDRWMRLSNGMIVVSLVHGDHTPRRTRLLGTYDGLKWYELWSDIEMMETPPQAHDGCLTEVDGYLYYQYAGYTPGTENITSNYIKFKIDTSFI